MHTMIGTIVVVILGAQLTLLLFVGVANLYRRHNDVLSGRYIFDQHDRPIRRERKHILAEQSDESGQANLLPPVIQRCLTIIQAFRPTRIPGRLSTGAPLWRWALSRFALRRPFKLARAAQSATSFRSPRIQPIEETTEVPARLPSGIRIYAIGDLHGRVDLLREMLGEVALDQKLRPVERSIILFLGDYVDRGPSSKEAVDTLLECADWNESVFLKGNHETFLTRFLADPEILSEWRLYGGLDTLASYGVNASFSPDEHERERLSKEFVQSIPADHLAFLDRLRPTFQCGEFLFVHAGVRPGVKIEDQAEKDLLWIREEFLDHSGPFGAFVVHGHTPTRSPEIRSNRLNIDTGAYATGRLTCAVIEASTIKLLSTGRSTASCDKISPALIAP